VPPSSHTRAPVSTSSILSGHRTSRNQSQSSIPRESTGSHGRSACNFDATSAVDSARPCALQQPARAFRPTAGFRRGKPFPDVRARHRARESRSGVSRSSG
jgi:hypothetical protein